MSSTASYSISCHCTSPLLPISSLLDSPLPTPAATGLCHCNPCRHASGSLGMSWPRLRAPPSQEVLRKCVGYESSAGLRRWFCAECGCKLFCEERIEGGGWWVASGCIERTPGSDVGGTGEEKQGGEGGEEVARIKVKDVVSINNHYFVSDTLDAGLAAKLLYLGGGSGGESREVPCWDTWPDTTLIPSSEIHKMERKAIEASEIKPVADDKLELRCHCGGVDLRIKRANYESDTQGLEEELIPDDKSKYLALLCACRSCRLTLGASLQPWCYVPLANITIAATGETVKLGKDVTNEGTTLKEYKSSEGIYRYFCGRCGASVLYWPEKPGRAMVDVAVGLLRAEEGVLARRWLSWPW